MMSVSTTSRLNTKLLLIIFAAICFLLLFTLLEPFYGTSHEIHEYIIKHSASREDDYARLINITFSFVHLPLVCQDTSPKFVIFVHSAPENAAKRAIIRDTWGNKDNNIKVLFMMGSAGDENIRSATAKEFEAHNDLIQGSFLDSYHNLTYKHVMVLKYAVYHCPEVKYVVKLDDDVFVNTPNLKEFLHLYHLENANSTNILCSRMYGNPVLRSGRWGVAIEEYPGELYPNHCSGYAIIYPQTAVTALYSQAQKTRYFWIDDVHVSGTLAKGANITHTGIEKLILSYEDVLGIVDFSFTNITKPFLIGYLNLNGHQITSLWNFVKQHTPIASILEFLE